MKSSLIYAIKLKFNYSQHGVVVCSDGATEIAKNKHALVRARSLRIQSFLYIHPSIHSPRYTFLINYFCAHSSCFLAALLCWYYTTLPPKLTYPHRHSLLSDDGYKNIFMTVVTSLCRGSNSLCDGESIFMFCYRCFSSEPRWKWKKCYKNPIKPF